MKVTYRQSGGATGLIRGVELDTASLPDVEAKELESLVRQGGIEGDSRLLSEKARDLRQFEIRVELASRGSTLVFDDESLPPALLPLVRFLAGKAKPMGREELR